MKALNSGEVKKVNGGVLPFAVQGALYLAGNLSAIYTVYRAAKKAGGYK